MRRASFNYNENEAASNELPRQNHERAKSNSRNADHQCPVEYDSALSQPGRANPSAFSQPSYPPNLDEARFVHRSLPLNTPSIRLISVETPKSDGTITCTTRHATLDTPSGSDDAHRLPEAETFTCLSYV